MSDLFGNHIVGFPTRRLKSRMPTCFCFIKKLFEVFVLSLSFFLLLQPLKVTHSGKSDIDNIPANNRVGLELSKHCRVPTDHYLKQFGSNRWAF